MGMRKRKNRISDRQNFHRTGVRLDSIFMGVITACPQSITEIHLPSDGESVTKWIIDCDPFPEGDVVNCVDHPFGGHFGESTAEALIGKNKDAVHRFGGKELRRCANLSFLDFPARPYDYSLMQFWTVDPLMEKYHKHFLKVTKA